MATDHIAVLSRQMVHTGGLHRITVEVTTVRAPAIVARSQTTEEASTAVRRQTTAEDRTADHHRRLIAVVLAGPRLAEAVTAGPHRPTIAGLWDVRPRPT